MSPFDLAAGAAAQPWRLWTCHAAHYGWRHALPNLAALAIPIALLPPRSRGRFAGALLLLAPLLSLALLPGLDGGRYCGASGLACAAWALAGFHLARARRTEGWLLLGLLAVKVLGEAWAGATLTPGGPGWVGLPAAHQWGMLLGALAAPSLQGGRAREGRGR